MEPYQVFIALWLVHLAFSAGLIFFYCNNYIEDE